MFKRGRNPQRLFQVLPVCIGPPGGQVPANTDRFFDRGQRFFPSA
jgi:hypothetical protein